VTIVELDTKCAVRRWFYDLAFYPGFAFFCQSAIAYCVLLTAYLPVFPSSFVDEIGFSLSANKKGRTKR